MDEHDRQYVSRSLGRQGALHAVCMMRRVAAHIHPSPIDGGVERESACRVATLGLVWWCLCGTPSVPFGRDWLLFELLLRYAPVIRSAAASFVREAWACGDRGPV